MALNKAAEILIRSSNATPEIHNTDLPNTRQLCRNLLYVLAMDYGLDFNIILYSKMSLLALALDIAVVTLFRQFLTATNSAPAQSKALNFVIRSSQQLIRCAHRAYLLQLLERFGFLLHTSYTSTIGPHVHQKEEKALAHKVCNDIALLTDIIAFQGQDILASEIRSEARRILDRVLLFIATNFIFLESATSPDHLFVEKKIIDAYTLIARETETSSNPIEKLGECRRGELTMDDVSRSLSQQTSLVHERHLQNQHFKYKNYKP
jgi:hypothetical protein